MLLEEIHRERERAVGLGLGIGLAVFAREGVVGSGKINSSGHGP